MTQTIGASVGCLGGANRPSDVKVIQELLNRVPKAAGGPWPLLDVDSVCGARTVASIQKFQERQLGWDRTDGRVDPEGPTLRKLNELAGTAGLPSKALTTRTALRCPHGAPVRVTLQGTQGTEPTGVAALRSTDRFAVAGCVLPIPCTWVNWVLASDPLIEGNLGICMSAEGAPLGKVKVATA